MATTILNKSLAADVLAYTHSLLEGDDDYVSSVNGSHLYKMGRTVFMTGYISFRDATAVPVDTVFAHLPEGFKPEAEWTIIAQRPTSSDSEQARVLLLRTDGGIVIHAGSAVTGGFLRFSGAYIAAEEDNQ